MLADENCLIGVSSPSSSRHNLDVLKEDDEKWNEEWHLLVTFDTFDLPIITDMPKPSIGSVETFWLQHNLPRT